MKFKVVVNVTNDKKGLELLSEYDRLGFDEDNRPDEFSGRHISVIVDREFAAKHKELFADISTANIYIDLSHTVEQDWEDWGSVGMVLSQDNFDEDRIEQLLTVAETSRF